MPFTSSPTVPTFKLSDGAHLPVLAWGNGTGEGKKKALQAGGWALESGIRNIDTAEGYGTETQVGESIEASGLKREDVWITTKLSQSGGDPSGPSVPLDQVRPQVLASIKALGTQPDLLLVHSPFVPPKGQLAALWKILEDLKDSGELTASLGVSNFRPQDLEELLRVAKCKPTVNQLEYHPFVLTHLAPVLAIHAAHNIRTTAYGPLTPLLRHPTHGGPLIPILTRISERLSKGKPAGKGIDNAGALFLWTYQTGAGIVSSSGNEGRIKQLGEVQAYMKEGEGLTKEEVEEISSVGKGIYFRGYPEHMCVDYDAPKVPSQ